MTTIFAHVDHLSTARTPDRRLVGKREIERDDEKAEEQNRSDKNSAGPSQISHHFSIYLLHNARLPLAEGCVTPKLVVDELHLDSHSPLCLLPVRRQLFFHLAAAMQRPRRRQLEAGHLLLPACLLVVAAAAAVAGELLAMVPEGGRLVELGLGVAVVFVTIAVKLVAIRVLNQLLLVRLSGRLLASAGHLLLRLVGHGRKSVFHRSTCCFYGPTCSRAANDPRPGSLHSCCLLEFDPITLAVGGGRGFG